MAAAAGALAASSAPQNSTQKTQHRAPLYSPLATALTCALLPTCYTHTPAFLPTLLQQCIALFVCALTTMPVITQARRINRAKTERHAVDGKACCGVGCARGSKFLPVQLPLTPRAPETRKWPPPCRACSGRAAPPPGRPAGRSGAAPSMRESGRRRRWSNRQPAGPQHSQPLPTPLHLRAPARAVPRHHQRRRQRRNVGHCCRDAAGAVRG